MKVTKKRQLTVFSYIICIVLLAWVLFAGCGEDSGGYRTDAGNGRAALAQPNPENSRIVVSPPVIPSDGEAEATVDVVLYYADEENTPMDFPVFLHATHGEITSANPYIVEAVYGRSVRASFTVKSSTISGRSVLTLPDFPDIEPAEMIFGSVGSGVPAGIRLESIHPNEIAVAGAGQLENSTVHVQLVDEAGGRIEDSSDYTLRARFLARPQGWEELSEVGRDGNRDHDSIEMDVAGGEVWFNVKSGELPGVIEVLLEVLQNGQAMDPPVTAVLPQISIAGGKPHTLILSAPRRGAVVNLNDGPDQGIDQKGGFYSRKASLSVLDRWGNAVPDGTVINAGVLDTVIASGTGSIIANSDILTDTAGGVDFSEASVIRNDTRRNIQPGDRVLIRNAKSQNKTRYVHDPDLGAASRLYVTKPYKDSESDLGYIVGASLTGAAIYGINEDGEATRGTVTTRNGMGEIRFVYPANSRTIHLGAVSDDPRIEPLGSARVISVFSTSDDSATLVDEGTLAFSSIAGWEVSARPEEISSSHRVRLHVIDGGDGIPLPFVRLSPSIGSVSGEGLTVDAESCTTDNSGSCYAWIRVSGQESGDSADITYYADGDEDAEVTISYSAP